MADNIPRPEYPRPQFKRNSFINLNGNWDFEIDTGKSGRDRSMFEPDSKDYSKTILVPYCMESSLSGIGITDFLEAVWYRRSFTVPVNWLNKKRRTILHFGACDYNTEVWINGISVGTHTGGYTSFEFEITRYLTGTDNIITVCASDDIRSGLQSTGKQCGKYNSFGCFYTRTTGIWQTVWLENIPSIHIASVRMVPDLEKSLLFIEADCKSAHGEIVKAEAFLEGKFVSCAKAEVVGNIARIYLEISNPKLWTVDTPTLYDLKLTLCEDTVESYFGMRSIAYFNNRLYLNGKPVFQRLVLDQGFYPDGIYTAPTDEDLKKDIMLGKAMGFNGARLHQKVFEERYLYYCDKLGYLVWGESADWGLAVNLPDAWADKIPEWIQILKRDYNHPAIIGWIPFNENYNGGSFLIETVVNLIKTIDKYRPVIDSSGWTHFTDCTDVFDVHDYEQDPKIFKDRYDKLNEYKPDDKDMITTIETYIDGGLKFRERQIDVQKAMSFVSEYGGISWIDQISGWSYGKTDSEKTFFDRYRGLTEALLFNPSISAFCYTQLTDVEQEQNGLYTYDRKEKFPPEMIKKINSQKAAIEE